MHWGSTRRSLLATRRIATTSGAAGGCIPRVGHLLRTLKRPNVGPPSSLVLGYPLENLRSRWSVSRSQRSMSCL